VAVIKRRLRDNRDILIDGEKREEEKQREKIEKRKRQEE